MKIGDLVENLSSESKMTGIVVGWKNRGPLGLAPRVLWADGRCNWAVMHLVRRIDENR